MSRKSLALARKDLVSRLAAQGMFQREIARQVESQGLGRISQQAVSSMLTRLDARWLTSTAEGSRAVRARQVESLEHLSREFLLAWERSKEPSRVERTKETTVEAGRGEGGDRVRLPAREVVLTVGARDGDPRFLAGLMKAMEGVRKLLGVDADLDRSGGHAGLADPLAAAAALKAAGLANGDGEGPSDVESRGEKPSAEDRSVVDAIVDR